ncbi:MAG: hypothetical protein V3R25_09955 [Nitrosomonadaceae bacterium]
MKYVLIALLALVTGCSEGGGGSSEAPPVPAPKTVTIFGDSLCYSSDTFDSWARRLNDVEGFEVNDLCIRGFRATYPIFAETIINDTSDIFIMALGVNDAVGMLIGEDFAELHGLTQQTIDDYRLAYTKIIGVALLNGSEVICVLPPMTGAPWVQPMIPQIWGVIDDVCGDVGTLVHSAPSDALDEIHYAEYGDQQMYKIMLDALDNL